MKTSPLRIWRSPLASFGEFSFDESDRSDETLGVAETYTDAELEGIAEAGFNAIWIHGILHHILPSPIFPEFGRNAEAHLTALRTLIERAGRHGIKVVLYLQPPRGIPAHDHAFWEAHPEVAGQREPWTDDDGVEGELVSLCTSHPTVQAYLKESGRNLASALPELGGLILITASEYPSHCIARTGRTIGALGETVEKDCHCPRCKDREPAEIVSEVITLVRDGVRSVRPTLPILAWNWSWTFYYDAPCREILSVLPKDVIVMAGFERGGRAAFCGREDHPVNEYSLAYPGPSEQFQETLDVCRELDLPVAAKFQIGTTHELGSVPNLPLLGSLYEKARFARENRLDGFMGCWNFGNMQSANTHAFNSFLNNTKDQDRREALTDFAADYLPGCDESKVTDAWEAFTRAMRHYPLGAPFLYAGPVNYSLTLIPEPAPLAGGSPGRSWMDDPRGDDLSPTLEEFSLEEVITGLDALSREWSEGLTLLREGLAPCSHAHAREELDNATVCGAAFSSCVNTYRIYELRLTWSQEKRDDYLQIIKAEQTTLEAILPILQRDSRLGFHIEAQAHQFSYNLCLAKKTALEAQIHQSDSCLPSV
ncbi:MAG: alpha-amylase family protein [Planctomycetota bacterium]|jgi:hypothetical protein